MATSEPLLPTPNTMDSLEPKKLERIVAHNQKARPGRSYLSQNLREVVYYGKRNLDGTSSQADSPVSLSPKLDEEKERKITAISGLKCLELYNLQNQHGSSLKTSVALLLGTTAWFSNKCALIWKAKVMKSNRLLFQLSPSMHCTEETGYGLLGTPKSQDERAALSDRGRHNMGEQVHGALNGRETGLRLQPNFVEWMMGYPKDWTELPDSKLLAMRLSHKSQSK